MQTGFPGLLRNVSQLRVFLKYVILENRSLQDIMHRAILLHMILIRGGIAMGFRIILLSCLLLLASGCSNDDPTRHNTFVPLTSIEVSGTYESMAVGTVNQYRAIGDFSGAFTRDITDEVSWSIGNDDIASVSIATGTEGLVNALAAGETSVTAMQGDLAGSGPVVVTEALLAGITIMPQDAELQAGITLQYEATGTFSDSSTQDITGLTTWESSDTAVATIEAAAGLATAVALGTTTISAAWQGLEGNAELLVNAAALTSITIIPEQATIAKGTTVQFTADGESSDGSTQDVTDLVDWQSADGGIAVVDTDGLATGVAPGTMDISATFETAGGTIEDTAELTVTDAVIRSIVITPEESRIVEGEKQQFTATGTFSDRSEQDVTELASWRTTDNSVGTISNTPGSRGLFASTARGTTFIEASFDGVTGQTDIIVD